MRSLIWFLIALCVAGIVASLAYGLFYLSRGKGAADSGKLARAFTVRISLSLVLFGLLMLAWYLGYITPHALGAAAAPHP